MSDRYEVLHEWVETDFPGGFVANAIHHVQVEDAVTGGADEGTGFSREEALADAITQLGGQG